MAHRIGSTAVYVRMEKANLGCRPASEARLSSVVMLAKSDTARDVMALNDANKRQVKLSVQQLDELLTVMVQAQVNRNDEIYLRQREMKEELSNLEDLKSVRDLMLE